MDFRFILYRLNRHIRTIRFRLFPDLSTEKRKKNM